MPYDDQYGQQRGRGRTVFIASTFSDLFDVRSELELYLRSIGLDPILSEISEAGFRASPPKPTLDTCFENLRKADFVVVLVSQRYGDCPANDGISYTRHEYREAIKLGKPVCFCVREKLWDCYENYMGLKRKNRKRKHKQGLPPCAWVQDKRVLERLLSFIEEHNAKAEGDKIVNPFRTLTDLRTLLRRWLDKVTSAVDYAQAQEAGRLPFIQAALSATPVRAGGLLYLDLTNIGDTPALFTSDAEAYACKPRQVVGNVGGGAVYIQGAEPERPKEPPTAAWSPARPAVLRPGESRVARLDMIEARSLGDEFEFRIAYRTVQELAIRQVYRVRIPEGANPELWFVCTELGN